MIKCSMFEFQTVFLIFVLIFLTLAEASTWRDLQSQPSVYSHFIASVFPTTTISVSSEIRTRKFSQVFISLRYARSQTNWLVQSGFVDRLHGGVVVSTIASHQEGSWFKSRLGLPVWSLPVSARVLSGYSGFLLPHVRLIGVWMVV